MKYVVYAGTRTAGFCFICGFRSDVGCCVVAVVESTRGVGGICGDVAFLAGRIRIACDNGCDNRWALAVLSSVRSKYE